jgi:hypothetical protein
MLLLRCQGQERNFKVQQVRLGQYDGHAYIEQPVGTGFRPGQNLLMMSPAIRTPLQNFCAAFSFTLLHQLYIWRKLRAVCTVDVFEHLLENEKLRCCRS